MTSLCRHLSPTNLSSSRAQEIVKWVTNADGCVHTADTTQLDFAVGVRKFVQTPQDCRQLVANSIHTADATQLDSLRRRCVLGFKNSGRYESLQHQLYSAIILVLSTRYPSTYCWIKTPGSEMEMGRLSWPMSHVTHHTVDPWPTCPMTHDPWPLHHFILRMGLGECVAWWYWKPSRSWEQKILD